MDVSQKEGGFKIRTRKEKAKDIKLAKLQQKVQKQAEKTKKQKEIALIIFVHLLVLLICVPIGAVYAVYTQKILQKPQNCKYFSYDLKYNFKAKCQICQEGFYRAEQNFACVEASKVS